MAISGERREQKSFDNQLVVGLAEVKVVAINPDMEEYKEILGIELKEDSKATEYLGESKDGNTTLRVNFWVEDIKTGTAEKVAGIACILTYKDVPQKRFTLAGQTAPEMSPDDRLILDRHVRFVGDAVAIVAGETEEAVDKALKRIRVDYRVETPVLDIHKAKDNPILIHPEDDWKLKIPLGGDNKRNLCASAVEEHGNVDEVLAKCKYTVERTYHTRANQQTMMETFRTACYMDHFGRLIVLSSTQIPFHVRRIVGRALDIPASKVRVIKPRIGGGFGAKQTSVSEIYPAIVTWKTGRPSKMIFSRYESMICSSPSRSR